MDSLLDFYSPTENVEEFASDRLITDYDSKPNRKSSSKNRGQSVAGKVRAYDRSLKTAYIPSRSGALLYILASDDEKITILNADGDHLKQIRMRSKIDRKKQAPRNRLRSMLEIGWLTTSPIFLLVTMVLVLLKSIFDLQGQEYALLTIDVVSVVGLLMILMLSVSFRRKINKRASK